MDRGRAVEVREEGRVDIHSAETGEGEDARWDEEAE